MRETKVLIPRTAREDYFSPGGPAPADKVSPLRGKRQIWAFEARLFSFRTRGDAMRFRRKHRLTSYPQRIFV